MEKYLQQKTHNIYCIHTIPSTILKVYKLCIIFKTQERLIVYSLITLILHINRVRTEDFRQNVNII